MNAQDQEPATCTVQCGNTSPVPLEAEGLIDPAYLEQVYEWIRDNERPVVFDLHDLPSVDEVTVSTLLQLIHTTCSDHDVRVRVDETLFLDPFEAVLACMVGPEDVRRCERGRRAAMIAAAIFHPGSADLTGGRIATKLRQLGVSGSRATTITRDIRALIPAPTESTDNAAGLADGFLVRLYLGEDAATGPLHLRYFQDGYWQWQGTHWEQIPHRLLRAQVTHYILGVVPDRTSLKTTVDNVIVALQGACLLDSWHETPPFLIISEDPLEVSRPKALNFANGVLVLDDALAAGTAIVQPHDSRYFCAYVLPFEFDASATCPLWLQTIAEILERTSADDRRIEVLQELFGYTLLQNDLTLQHFFVLVGDGANGKSLVLKILTQMLGESNVSHVPLESIGGEFRTGEMRAKFANIVGDMNRVDRAEEGLLKLLTSGDPVSTNEKYKDPGTMVPTAKLIFATNVLPRFADRSDGIWRRMKVVPFLRKFEGPDNDTERQSHLEAELPGIFNWALQGLRRLRVQHGFTTCPRCETVVTRHRLDSDPFAQFVDEHLSFGEGLTLTTRQAYASYQTFTSQSGFRTVGISEFGRRMSQLPGVTEAPRATTREGRLRCWQGVALLGYAMGSGMITSRSASTELAP